MLFGKGKNSSLIFLFFLCLSASAQATEVNVIGLFPGKAVVVIDGGKPRTLSAGQTSPEGVKLISADQNSAVVEIAGKRQTLNIGKTISSGYAAAGNPSITLYPDARGHFITTLHINGAPVKFLVDTGASMVTLGNSEARRLGINYLKGERTVVMTANGPAPVYRVKVDGIKLGGIMINNVDTLVTEGDQVGIGLLGMSFLNHFDMKRDSESLTLIKKY